MKGISPTALHHTYIISGDRSRTLSKLLVFIEKKLSVATKGNPDFWLKEYETLTIDDAREIGRLQSNTTLEKLQVFVISASQITSEAQNAFLKVMEEPSERTCFFFIIPSIEQILPTFRSRAVAVSGEAEGSEPDIDFLSLSPKERIAQVDILMEKGRESIFQFLNSIETKLQVTAHTNELRALYTARKMLQSSSAPTKMILEHLVLKLPVKKS